MKRRKPSLRARLDPDKARARLNVLNISQRELVRLIGRSPNFVSDLFTGRRRAAGETRGRLMEALQVSSLEDLFILEEAND